MDQLQKDFQWAIDHDDYLEEKFHSDKVEEEKADQKPVDKK